MKLHELNFREINQKIVRITGEEIVKQINSMNIELDGLLGGFFYVYIDHEKGLTFELLAIETSDGQFRIAPKEYSYKLRCRPLFDEEIEIVSGINMDLFKEKIDIINETYKVSVDVERLRYLKDLDDSRHSEYPDDVKVFFLKEGLDVEACWVRLTGVTDRKICGKLLTKPMQNFDLELEEIIEFQTVIMEDKSISCVCVIK